MPAKLDGAYLKLERSKHHIDDLHFQIRQFCENGIRRITVERDAKTGNETLNIALAKTVVPAGFSLILGDALHNLAAALDHAWFELTAVDSPSERKVNFPIYPTGEHLRKYIANRPKQASLLAVSGKILDDIQPYHRGKGDALYTVHHLNIADKHRLLIPQVQIGRIEKIRYENSDGVQFEVGPKRFRSGNIVRISLGSRRNVKVIDEGESTLAVVFGVIQPVERIAGLPLIPELLKMWRTVRNTLAILSS